MDVTQIHAWVPVAITPSDTVTNALGADGRPYAHLQNRGTSGSVPILWLDGTTVAIYLAQGQVISGGRWKRVNSTSLGAGVDLVGLYGYPR